MKNKLLCFVLVLCLALPLFSLSAFALSDSNTYYQSCYIPDSDVYFPASSSSYVGVYGFVCDRNYKILYAFTFLIYGANYTGEGNNTVKIDNGLCFVDYLSSTKVNLTTLDGLLLYFVGSSGSPNDRFLSLLNSNFAKVENPFPKSYYNTEFVLKNELNFITPLYCIEVADNTAFTLQRFTYNSNNGVTLISDGDFLGLGLNMTFDYGNDKEDIHTNLHGLCVHNKWWYDSSTEDNYVNVETPTLYRYKLVISRPQEFSESHDNYDVLWELLRNSDSFVNLSFDNESVADIGYYIGSFVSGIISALDELVIFATYSVLDVIKFFVSLSVIIFILKLMAGG